MLGSTLKKVGMLSTFPCLFHPYQELQRRLDQTLGKPGSYLSGIDKAGNVKPMTIGARLYRVEQQVRTLPKTYSYCVMMYSRMSAKVLDV